ncbi:MAG: hypothetical protein ACOX8W_11505 [bacterium]|jgi:hypothetical protein
MVTSTEYTQRANDISNSSDVAIVADDSYELTTSVDSHGIAIGYSTFDNAIRTEVGQMSQAASNGALAGPAHPNNGIYYWYEHDFADITIKTTELGDSGVYSSGNIGYWDQYLLQGDWLVNTISSGNFVIGIGGSDAHYDPADVLDAVTWVKSTWSVTPPKSSKTVIKNAIAAKRVSFGFKTHTFADMSLSQGSTLYMGGKGGLNNSDTISITVSHVPLGDVINNVTNVRLYRYDTVGGLVSRNYSPSSRVLTILCKPPRPDKMNWKREVSLWRKSTGTN